SIRSRETLGPWLHGVARRVAVRARQTARRRATLALDDNLAPSAPGRDILEIREATARLHDEIDRLPRKYRDPIVLCHLQGWTHEEAAACLKWPVGTVRGRLFRARELLKRRLERRGVTSASALPLAPALYDVAARLAVVPDPLRAATLRAALGFAATRSLVGFVSAHVFTLVNGAIEAMFVQQLKWIGVGACGLGLLAAGGTTVAYQLGGKPDPKGAAKIAASTRIAQDARLAKPAPPSDSKPTPSTDSKSTPAAPTDSEASPVDQLQEQLDLLDIRIQLNDYKRSNIEGVIAGSIGRISQIERQTEDQRAAEKEGRLPRRGQPRAGMMAGGAVSPLKSPEEQTKDAWDRIKAKRLEKIKVVSERAALLKQRKDILQKLQKLGVAPPAQEAQDSEPAKPAPASEQTPSEVNYDALDKANSEGEIAQMKLKLLQTRLQTQQQLVYDLEFDPSPLFARRAGNQIVQEERMTAEELKKVRAERDANVAHARRLLKTLEERFDAASHEVADAKRRAEAIKGRLKAVPSGLKTVGTHAPGRDSTPAELDAADLDREGRIADLKAEIVLAKVPIERYFAQLRNQTAEDSAYVSALNSAKSNLEAARKQLRGEPSEPQYGDPNAAKQGLKREIADLELQIKVVPEQRAKARREYLENSKRLANLEYQLKRLEAERDRVFPDRGSTIEGTPAGPKPTKAE
ncbi:MAG: hypothetical protein KGM43_12375, partial [Planctomycetota bacterium]|nr:hypothetical protein [Planctomycetota bacterium]